MTSLENCKSLEISWNMASHIIIGDSDDDSENDIGKQERSIESLGGLVKAGAVSEPRQRDSLHDSTDSTG